MSTLPEVLEHGLTTARRVPLLDRVLTWARIDLDPPHRQPAWWRVGLATVLALVGSLLADAALVAVGTHAFPSTTGYSHFQFADYAKLTVVGVVIACVGWPIVTRVCAAPRRLFFWLAVVVTLVLFLPDVWIRWKGQPTDGVGVLMVMHVAIALITYNLLVRLVPVRPRRTVPEARMPDPQTALR